MLEATNALLPRRTRRLLVCGYGSKARLPLTSLETSCLRHALELMRMDLVPLRDRLSEGGTRRVPQDCHLHSLLGGLIDHLLTGRGVRHDPPDVAAWRVHVIAGEDVPSHAPSAESDAVGGSIPSSD